MIKHKQLSMCPECTVIDCSLISGRIDAWFYRSVFLELEDKLSSMANTPCVRLDEIAGIYRDPFCYGMPYIQDGIPYIRAEEANQGLVDPKKSVRVSEESLQKFSKAGLEPSDLIMTVRGANVGTTGLLPVDPNFVGLASPNIIRIRTRTKFNPQYLWAFLSSESGRLQTSRYPSQTAQPTILGADIKSFRVFFPDRPIQDYIGNKVELAERCRAEAARQRTQSCRLLFEAWDSDRAISDVEFGSQVRAHWVSPLVFDERLDSEFYQPCYLKLANDLLESDCWLLRDLVDTPIKGVQPVYDDEGSIPALTVTHIDAFIIDVFGANGRVSPEWLNLNSRANARPGEILITVTGPPLGETVVVEEFHSSIAISSHIARVQTKDSFAYPNLLSAMLNSTLGQLQVTRSCKGIRQKELYPEDFLKFRFPKIQDTLIQELESSFRSSCVLYEEARALIATAKADVEALIIGTLDTDAILSGKLKSPTWEAIAAPIDRED